MQWAGIVLPGVRLNDDAPFGKGFGSCEACGDGPEGRFAEANAGFVGAFEEVDQRANAAPSHRPRPAQRGVGPVIIFVSGQQCAVPVVFENPPATFDCVVLAVIRRIVRQLQGQLMPVGELDQPLHELRASTADLGAVVEIDLQSSHVAIHFTAIRPPQRRARRRRNRWCRATCRTRCSTGPSRPPRCRPARHAAARELADLHFGLGVERDAQRVWFLRRLRVNLLQVREDGVGLGKFF